MTCTSLIFAFFILSSVAARSPLFNPHNSRPRIPHIDEPDESQPVYHFTSGQQISSYGETYYFDQLVDHTDPTKGTFKQRYWHNYEFYEPGGPIVLMTPGEESAKGFTGYLTNGTISGMIAQATKGSTIVIEHRFFGDSNPHPDLSVQSLQVHTIEQAIEDLAYFAKTVKLPQPDGDKLAPGKAPWILVGGSYSGALVSYTMHTHPELFYAGYASSAVVQAIGHFWKYFEPVREWMPANCSADVQAVIQYVDSVLDSGNTRDIADIKANFGLQDVIHLDDFAAALKAVFEDWQSNSITSRSNSFYEFCDALEVGPNGWHAPASGWGLEAALQAWGKYWNETLYPSRCGKLDAESCIGSHNPDSPHWTNASLPNSNRSWNWMICNQFGFWQVGAPEGTPRIVSSYLTAAHNERLCQYEFPGAFWGLKKVSLLNALTVDKTYGGWDTTTERLIFANGERDPWREATVAAALATRNSTDLQPHLLSDGFHCSDMSRGSAISPRIAAVQKQALQYMTQWHAAWKPSAAT
ncbi:peptidase S28 [Dichomitus squalens]|uniref:Peptidase S28 n=1 Tax=Dichomitus squalens TaxID=114155 RepID=A0A4Q9MSH2_9APHY|nr:peptidase S28 [Dichomitus squalens]